MAYGSNPYSAYKEIGVKTASQGKLVVLLYEGAASNLEKAISLISDEGKVKPSDIENFGNYLQKVMDIITELEISLNMEQGGEIAKNLMSLYVFFNKQVLDCTISHDKSKLKFVHNMLSQLHESWIVASNSMANTQTKISGNTQALNITG